MLEFAMFRSGFVTLIFFLCSAPALAQSQFFFNQEFFDVCDAGQMTKDTAEIRFSDAQWGPTGEEIKEALKPDDVMVKVKRYSAYEIGLEDGSYFFGGHASGNLNKRLPVDLCFILIMTDDLTEWREDFQKGLADREPEQFIEQDVEKRYAWSALGQAEGEAGGYIFREISAGDDSYIMAARYWTR